jgi:NAD(P)-dependent dehydrogenase (short-subunit alcohol dehydrogenase family)
MRTGGAVIDFSGQAAIVTGAGRGLGRLYAHELARRGAQVVVNDIGGSMSGAGSDTNVADGVVEEIRQAGGTAVASYDSVDTPEGGAAIVQTAVDAFGRVDAVVSNAGIYETARFDQVTPERWRKMLEVHLDGGFYLAQPAYVQMKEQGYGRFVFISSQMGAFGQDHNAAYAAAKAGLIGLTNVIAIEGARHGIRANTVLPIGYSRMVSESVGDRPLTDTEEAFFKRIEPERVVPLVVYFASRACEVSHHNVSAAAGRYARAFMGLSEGWLADPEASPPSADDIAEHYAEIASTDRFAVPMSSYEEIVGVCERLGIQ